MKSDILLALVLAVTRVGSSRISLLSFSTIFLLRKGNLENLHNEGTSVLGYHSMSFAAQGSKRNDVTCVHYVTTAGSISMLLRIQRLRTK